MKRFTNYAVAITLMCLMAAIASAQTTDRSPKSPADIATRQTAKMKEKLNLNADQEKKVYELNLRFAEQQQEILKSDKLREEKMQSTRELQQKKDQEIIRLLDNNQQQQYRQMREEMKDRMRERRHKKQGLRG